MIATPNKASVNVACGSPAFGTATRVAPSRTATTINGFASSNATNSRIAAFSHDRVNAGPALPANVNGSRMINNSRAMLRINKVTIATTIVITNNRHTNSPVNDPVWYVGTGRPEPGPG